MDTTPYLMIESEIRALVQSYIDAGMYLSGSTGSVDYAMDVLDRIIAHSRKALREITYEG